MKNLAPCISILGTASDVGKSIIATALCRIFSDMGISVAPFKAQNMSNNSFVVEGHNGEWGEMGRAQVAQAEAARVRPHVDMNPVLLKPVTNVGAQVIVLGKAMGESSAAEYGNRTRLLRQISLQSLQRLREQFELVVMEGAGSCAEVNLRDRDFVNFEMVLATDAKVVLVADIDRGGVFAQIIGTMELLSPEERKQVVGIIINRFRGDVSLFEDGIAFLEERCRVPVLGVVPYIDQLGIDGEDAVVLDTWSKQPVEDDQKCHLAVIHLPHISNFTDFAPFEKMESVSLSYLRSATPLDRFDAVLLPGTKNVRGDLHWLKQTGFQRALLQYVANGGVVVGICGGYQMLGNRIGDPDGIEGPGGLSEGLGFLDTCTVLGPEKQLRRRTGRWLPNDAEVWGYEIHHGTTTAGASLAPAVCFDDTDETDGVISATGRIWGTYLHGIFDSDEFRYLFLHGLRPDLFSADPRLLRHSEGDPVEDAYDRLARIVKENVSLEPLLALCK